ncbi:MAG TPA: cation:proton antiporter, partial [Longimicrobiales bacterium]|nr:cation:proton antiporter [Longimicrobiales bacterium]
LFAEVGVALLLFLVGLELSVEKIRALGTTALITGLVQVAVTFAAGYGVAHALGFSGTTPVVLGLVAAFSSTVVVIKLLDRAGGLDALTGRLAIGVLLVQDVLVAVALTFFSAVGGGAGGGGSPAAALATAFGVVAAMGVVGAGVSRWILPPFLNWLEESGEGLFLFALAWAFVFILVAESYHLSVELGAFLAGVLLAQLRQSEELWRRTRPLVDFFLAVFFISLGSHMDLGAMGGNWAAAGAMALLVLVGKPLVIAVILGLQGQSPRVAVVTGLTLGQVSEFAFILTGLAIASGSVGPEMAGFVGVLGMVTIGASALLVPHADAVAAWMDEKGLLRLLPGRPGAEAVAPAPPRSGHVVVVGMNTLGRRLVQGFSALGESVLAVDTDLLKLSGLPGSALVGDLTVPDVAEEAGLERALLVVSALQIEEVNDLLAYQCRLAGVPTSIHAFDPSLSDELLEIGVDHLLIPKQEGVGLMESRLRSLGVLG